MTEAMQIRERITQAPAGSVFIPSDFLDIASIDNVNATLSRLVSANSLVRVRRGIYAKPKVSRILGTEVPPSPDDIAYALARQNRWVIAPTGNTALNRLGLDTQVPAVAEYVSTGPYKSYEYGKSHIVFKHRASRDLIECSPLTCLVVQALKALGKENVGADIATKLAARLSADEICMLYNETRGTTSWVFEFAKQLKENAEC